MSSAFDDLTDVYEAMIDWPKRLAAEERFYRRLFDQVGVRNLLDVACGTGRHAAMFHSWGLRVDGADVSPGMIDRARSNFGEPDGLRWVVRGFDQPAEPPQPFDVALCVGNSLALASDLAAAHEAIGRMFEAVRPGGAVVVHVLNLWRLPDGPSVWQKCIRTELPQGEVLVIKGVNRCGDRGFVNLLVTELQGGPTLHSESVPLLGLEASQLQQAARQAGASSVQCFGGYRDEPYDGDTSTDLVMVARK